ncbi:MAG: SpoIID/LytB domain-containing protein [Gaiellaceae bacterium]
MRRFALRLGVVCLLASAGAAATLLAARPGAGRADTGTAPAATAAITTNSAAVVLAVSGRGWGHGLGLSQWGAKGYAEHGWTYDRILGHYYPGTTLGPAAASTARVLLAEAGKALVGSAGDWSVTDAAGTKLALPAGTLTLKPKLALAGVAAKAKPARPPFTFAGTQPLTLDGKPYRGKLVVSSDGKRVQVVDVVGLEAYLEGVVPAEMPSAWPPAALEAQAVASRSYTLANLTKSRDFDLYGDTRDQAYGGVDAESTQASAAVEATRGRVVLYHGKVADTLFSSTSGGRTASAAESIGTAVPYLVPVADPYDAASPYHTWGPVLYDATKAARMLKVEPPLVDLRTLDGASGRVSTAVAVSPGDAQATFTGSQIRAALGLRSTWFQAALLSLAPAAKTITYGGAVSLSGFGQGVDAVSLEAKPAGGDWSAAGALALGSDGVFSTVVKPRLGTQYRIAWGSVRAGLARIAVAPLVSGGIGATGGQGAVAPAVTGAPVQLQRREGPAWKTVTSGSTGAGGSWSFAQPLQAGSYRVRCVPGQGLAAGVSATFQVP